MNINFTNVDSSKETRLRNLYNDMDQCNTCPFRNECIAPVGSFGNPNSPIMFVAEAPGEVEDEYGCPMIGISGQIFNDIIWDLGVSRDKIFSTNVVKCRPHHNRTPQLQEAKVCGDRWLKKEIEIIQPRVIVTLGKISTGYIQGMLKPITRQRGNWYYYKDISCMPTYHPAFLCRQEGDSLDSAKNLMYSDIIKGFTRAYFSNPLYSFESTRKTDLFALFSPRITF